jgi:hypothetical protein
MATPAIPDPALLGRGTLRGTLTRAEIDAAVAHYWAANEFVHRLAPGTLPEVAPGGAPRRYGLCDRLTAELLYGTRGVPGCLLITTPRQAPYDRAFRRFLVDPHVHDSAHITLMLRGRALFLIARGEGPAALLLTAEVGPGTIILYPAGAPHTFVSDEEFQVASLQAAYEDPSGGAFAARAELPFDRLPRRRYEDRFAPARPRVASS